MLPQTLDVGDGMTHDRAAALRATRLQMAALLALFEEPSMTENLADLAVLQVADLLGGDDWLEIADQLVNEVLEEASEA
jgi:hypothetical protein